jgi:hypothetical protein
MTIEETLVEGPMLDPGALAERVLQQVLQQLAQVAAGSSDGEASPEELIGNVVGNWIAQMTGTAPESVDHQPDLAAYEALVDRNSALAAAVGACDCWGEDAECPLCEGYGSPAWVRPDPQLFAEYAYPAVRSLSTPRVSPADHDLG